MNIPRDPFPRDLFKGTAKDADSVASALGKVDGKLRALEADQKKAAIRAEKDPIKRYKMELGLERDLLSQKATLLAAEGAKRKAAADVAEKAASKAAQQQQRDSMATAAAMRSLSTTFLTVASAAGEYASAAAQFTAGAALDAVKFREDSTFALRFMLGAGEAAGTTFGFMQRISTTLGVQSAEAMGQFRKILSTGVREGEAQQLTQLAQDIQKASGVDVSGALGSAVMALKKNAPLTVDSFAALRDAGISGTRLNDILAKRLNITEKDDNRRAQKVQQALASQAMRGQKALDFWGKVMLDATGKDKAGALAQEKQNTTVTGSIDKVRAKWTSLMGAIDNKGPGSSLVAVLQKVAAAIDPGTDSGKRLLATLDRAAATAGDLFDAAAGADMIAVLEDVADAVDGVLATAKALGGGVWDGMREAKQTVDEVRESLGLLDNSSMMTGASLASLGKMAGYFVVGLATVAGIAVGTADAILAALITLPDNLVFIGREMINGIGAGIDSAKASLIAKLEALAELLPASVRKLLKINSPSKVFAEIGDYTGQGLAHGVKRSAPLVEASAGQLAASATNGALQASSAGGAAPRPAIVLPPGLVQITIQGGGAVDGDEIERRVQEGILAALRAIGFEMGAPQ